ncbi:hypothetical protein HKX48_003824 [Thoreauomyces humboldtii]|nr:hypothetical protein HKX48_003824 [Thoreauomyces humboldtii]
MPSVEETSIAGIPLRNKIYIRIPGCSEAWILIAAASARDWASGTAMETEDLDTALRVWLVDTKFEGQSIRRFGRAKREMNREITCLTPIFASDALDDQTALKYAYARQRTTVQNGPRAALEYWRVMDPDALSAIERVCRLRHAYRLVIRGITSRNLSYGYLSPTGSSVTLPDELTAEDTETRIARREAKLCIPEDDIAGALGLHSADTISAQASAPIFGDLYLSLEHTVLAGRESGPGSLPNERLPIGNTSPLRGVRITAICGVRLGPARDMIVQRDVSNGMWLYKAATNALHFTFVGVRLMESCIASILDELRAIGSLVELARQASVNQARLREIGARVVSFDLQCLSVCYQNTLSIKISAVDPQQQLLGLEIAANGGGRRQFQAELISAGATDQSRQIPVQIVDRIKGFWEERLNKDGNLPNSLLLLWHLAPLFRMVRDLEHERNVGMYTVGEGVPFVSLVFQSLTRVQLVYAGLYGVEFGLLPSGQIGFYDSTQLPGRVSPPIPPTGIPLSVQRRRLLQPPPPNPADGLARIPLFSGLIQTICRAVHDTALPRGTTVVPLCFGVLFDPPLLKFVVEKMDSHLNNVGLLLWLENEAAKKLPLPKGFPKNALVDLPSMRATIRTETRGVIVKVSAASTWDVTMIPFAKAPGGALHEPFLTPELLTGLAQLLATKLNALPPGTDLRPFFIFFLDFLAMPADLLLNFVTIARDEALSRQRGPSEEPMTVEWCLAIPSDAPAYLGASGAPATLLEVDKRRVSVMFRLTNRPTGEHALVPVRYNWSTKVIGRWLRPGADDLTEISEMNPFMEQHMHNAQQEDSLAGLMARATLRGKPNENQTSPSAEIATLLKTASLKCTEAGMQWIRA